MYFNFGGDVVEYWVAFGYAHRLIYPIGCDNRKYRNDFLVRILSTFRSTVWYLCKIVCFLISGHRIGIFKEC
jgi:hypothetical protein